MADTVRTKSELKTIFADNTNGDISAQDMRDFVETVFDHDDNTSNPHNVTASQVGAAGTATTITAGDGLSGGGDLSANRTLAVDINGATSATVATGDEILIGDVDDTNGIKKTTAGALANLADHDALTNYVANEHIDHSSVDITAGDGLSGGGDITTSRTLAVDIANATSGALATGDELLFADVDDGDAIKKCTAQDIVDLVDVGIAGVDIQSDSVLTADDATVLNFSSDFTVVSAGSGYTSADISLAGRAFTADGDFAAYQGTNVDAGAGSTIGGLAQGSNATASGTKGCFAQGFNVTASASTGCFAQGSNSTASGNYGVFAQGGRSVTFSVVASGFHGCFAQGDSCTSNFGYGSFAQGQNAKATAGRGCFVQGAISTASGSMGCFAQGQNASALANVGCFAQGSSVTASGTKGSFAQGNDVTASGNNGCFAQGFASYATGDYGCFAQGGGNFGAYVLASGNYGCFAQGYNCTATGAEGSFAQGNISTSSGSAGAFAQGRSTASGNFGSFAQGFATASGNFGSFAQGYNALASGNFGCFAQGSAVTASAAGSWAVGLQALANKIGQHARSNGRFSANGDAQYSTLISRNQTTDATQTELFLDGSSARITIASGKLYVFSILVAGRQSGGASGSAGDGWGYKLEGVIKNTGGTTTLQGVTKTILAETDSAFDATAAADDTNDALIIQVTGAANKNVNWVATTLLTEVG